MNGYVKDYEQINIRHGPHLKEVRRAWMWDHPGTVVTAITFNGVHPSGQREYMVFWRKRKRPSKKQRYIESLKARGAKDVRGK